MRPPGGKPIQSHPRYGEVIVGQGRILAAAELGLTEATVIVLDHLTEEQRKAYRNR